MDDCREWHGPARGSPGYRSIHREYVHRRVVRLVGEDQFGTRWDPKLQVLHLCDNPPCVLYAHLKLGTHAENMAQMSERGRARNSGKTECKRGHELDEENTYRYPDGRRDCRRCRAEREGRL